MQRFRALMVGAVALVCSLSAAQGAILSPSLAHKAPQNSVEGANGPLLQPIQYYDRYRDGYGDRDGRYRDDRRGRGDYGRGYRGRDDGAAVAAGVFGLVLGAAIAGSANERAYARSHMRDRAWLDSCARRYRSFDPPSGTYMGYDGYRHYCS